MSKKVQKLKFLRYNIVIAKPDSYKRIAKNPQRQLGYYKTLTTVQTIIEKLQSVQKHTDIHITLHREYVTRATKYNKKVKIIHGANKFQKITKQTNQPNKQNN